jgi:hypothetical protein
VSVCVHSVCIQVYVCIVCVVFTTHICICECVCA